MSEMYQREPGERELWRGRQWTVTTHALQCQITRAEIPIDRLAGYSWLNHMAEKTWLDLDDFIHGTQIADIAATIRRARAKAAGHSAAAKVAAELYPADDMNLTDIDGFYKIYQAGENAAKAYLAEMEEQKGD